MQVQFVSYNMRFLKIKPVESLANASVVLERLTPSNFGKACKLRDTTNQYNSVKSISYTSWSGDAATTYSQDQESVSEDMYGDYISENYVGACIKEILKSSL